MFLRLLKLVTPYRWWMLLAALLGFLTIGSSIGLMMTSAYVISKAALHPSIAELQVGIVGVRFFGITRGVFRYLERIVSHQTTFRLLAEFRVWFYKKLEPLAPAGLQEHHSGDLQSRIISDINTLENFYQRVLYPPCVAFFVTLLTFVLYGQFSLMLTFVILGGMSFTGLVLPILVVRHTRTLGDFISEKRSQLTRLSVDYIQGLSDLIAFGQAAEWLHKVQTAAQELNAAKRRFARIENFYQSLVGLLMNATILMVLFVAAPMIAEQTLNGVYLGVLALGVMAAFEAIHPLPQAAQYWQENRAAADRLFNLTQQPLPVTRTAPPIQEQGIVFQNVSFAYENEPVLENINLHIAPGDKVVIVGASGSGKSTLVNLLMNFWSPQQGSIYLDGVPISGLPHNELAKKIVVVPQNSYLYSASVQENLLMRHAAASQSEIVAACQKAEFSSVLQSLPNGFDTWIGEHGTRLSGGEQQRLALAQALLQPAEYYVFDEPSANLDAALEQKIFEQLYSLPHTVVVISHRLVDLERADQIIVMQHGRIVEHGQFHELQNSILSRMLHIQNDWLQDEE